MPDDERARLRELQRFAILDTPPEPRFDRITRLAARLFGVPVALVSLVDEHRQWFKSRHGTETRGTPREISFCTHGITSDEVLVVPDAALDPRFASSPLVTSAPHIRFYAGAPLITESGFRLGMLCLNDSVPHPEGLTPEQKATLRDLAAVVVDELELRLAERARGEIQRLLASVFETAEIGISVTDDAGRFAHINRAFCRLSGYSASELLGREFWMVLAEDLRDDAAQAHAAFIARGEPMPQEWRWQTKDGRQITVYITAALLLGEDGRRFRVATITDVSQIRQAEAALRESNQRLSQLAAIIESSDDAIIGRDLNGIITSWNAGAERLYGYPAAAMLGRHYSMLVPEERRQELAPMETMLERGEPVTAYETVNLRQDGTRIQVSLTLSPIKDAHGHLTGVSAILRDITSHKQLESQLIQSQKMEAVALLAGGVAHDFNNLLTVITGYGRMLLLGADPDGEVHEYAEEILYSAERATALTGQLLAFSRRQVAKPRVLDLNEIVQSMHKLLVRILGEHIRLQTVPGADLGRVKADPGQVEQVIANLAVNARDAMPRGGSLTIETANVELDEAYTRMHPGVRPGAYVMLAVSDSGAGMTADVQQHIFEPFFTTKEKGKGTGLGLSILHGIVKQAGGEIWVYSEPGKGTTFKIYLPRVSETAATWSPPPRAGARMPRGEETILIVEDEKSVQKMVREILVKLGYQVLTAGDGQKALELCGSGAGPIHLMVTDVVMPGMAGPDLARAVKLLRPETRVIFMSGYTESSILHQDLFAPGTHFLQKPFTPEQFAQYVRQVLDGSG